MQQQIESILGEYTELFLNDFLYWRPILEGVYTLADQVDMDDVVKANLWLDLKGRITKALTPKPKAGDNGH